MRTISIKAQPVRRTDRPEQGALLFPWYWKS
jgi:hypothetical protein